MIANVCSKKYKCQVLARHHCIYPNITFSKNDIRHKSVQTVRNSRQTSCHRVRHSKQTVVFVFCFVPKSVENSSQGPVDYNCWDQTRSLLRISSKRKDGRKKVHESFDMVLMDSISFDNFIRSQTRCLRSCRIERRLRRQCLTKNYSQVGLTVVGGTSGPPMYASIKVRHDGSSFFESVIVDKTAINTGLSRQCKTISDNNTGCWIFLLLDLFLVW